jgi:erythromycin esterase-like protein
MSVSSAKLNSSVLREVVHPLRGEAHDYDPVLSLVGNASLCLLGEATHGTYEFYRERAEITKRLIKEKGFTAVAVEADWPDAFRVNRYVRGLGDDKDANEALGGFKRFPTWMWRNTVVLDFVEWLREHNASLPLTAPKVGFYGLDLYSLYTSMEAVLGYLSKIDPEAAKRARYRYSCFEHFSEDTQAYGYATSFGLSSSTGVSPEMNSSSRSRMRGWCATPRSITARCFMGEWSRGTCAIDTWPKPSKLC